MENTRYQGRATVADEKVCPHCGSTDVRKSHRRAGGLFHTTYRCRQCKRHFKVRAYWGYGIIAGGAVAVLVAGFSMGWFSSPGAIEEAHMATQAAAEISPVEFALAKKGDAAMQFKLGMQYWARLDYQKAFDWIKAAADRGHPDAIYQLGMAYLYGRGTIQNYKYAQQRFEQAARLNNHEAQYLLGIMHRDGMGVPVSRDLAYAWLNIAASNGNEVAALERERMAAVMSPAEMARAQEISLQAMTGIAPKGEGAPSGQAVAAPQP
jgi:tetratricopeptide (TPR) repeat protein